MFILNFGKRSKIAINCRFARKLTNRVRNYEVHKFTVIREEVVEGGAGGRFPKKYLSGIGGVEAEGYWANFSDGDNRVHYFR